MWSVAREMFTHKLIDMAEQRSAPLAQRRAALHFGPESYGSIAVTRAKAGLRHRRCASAGQLAVFRGHSRP